MHQHQRRSRCPAHRARANRLPRTLRRFMAHPCCSVAGSLLRKIVSLPAICLRIGNQAAGFGLGFDGGGVIPLGGIAMGQRVEVPAQTLSPIQRSIVALCLTRGRAARGPVRPTFRSGEPPRRNLPRCWRPARPIGCRGSNVGIFVDLVARESGPRLAINSSVFCRCSADGSGKR